MKINVLGSGSKGNCTIVSSDKTNIMIDAGFNAKQLTLKLELAKIDPSEIDAILITHEHTDHIKGLRIFADRHNITTYCNRNTAEVLRFSSKNIAPKKFKLFENGQTITIGDCQVLPISIRHDAADASAYTITHLNTKVGFATDLGVAGRAVTQHLKDVDFLMIESNHDKELLLQSDRSYSLKSRIAGSMGHLSNEQTLDLLRETLTSRTRYLVLAHLSSDCNTPTLVKNGVDRLVNEMGLNGLHIQIAKQETPLPVIEL
ncbi:MAG: MBL fold metallo-hydrolase [Lentisphaeria bacterium]|nr:MBL fold metallo-hydrolase [Lentisphaeria bacterium]